MTRVASELLCNTNSIPPEASDMQAEEAQPSAGTEDEVQHEGDVTAPNESTKRECSSSRIPAWLGETLSSIEPLPSESQGSSSDSRCRSSSQPGAHQVHQSTPGPSVPSQQSRRSDNSTNIDTEDSHPAAALVEAELVEEGQVHNSNGPSSELVLAEEVKTDSYSRVCIRTLLLVVALIALLLVLVVALLMSRSDNRNEALEEAVTSQDEDPDNSNDLSDVGEEAPFQCFQYTSELYDAVEAYWRDPSNNSTVALTYGWPIGQWCVDQLQDFLQVLKPHRSQATERSQEAIRNAYQFEQDIGGWNMSNAKYMREMMRGGKRMSAHWGIDQWDVSNVIDMQELFMSTLWIEPLLDLGAWNTSNVISFNQMFRKANVTTAGISSWDSRSLQDMGQFASEAHSFNDAIGNWNTARVWSLHRAFQRATLFNQDISRWNTQSLVRIDFAFEEATSFDQDLASWDVSKVATMAGAFRGAASFNQDLSAWNVSSATSLYMMFHGASSFQQDLCAWSLQVPQGAAVKDMFADTACPNTSDPILEEGGPFCFNCNTNSSR